MTRGACARVAPDVGKGLLKFVNEPECSLFSVFCQVVRNRFIYISQGLLTRDEGFDLQAQAPALLPCCTRLRKPSK